MKMTTLREGMVFEDTSGLFWGAGKDDKRLLCVSLTVVDGQASAICIPLSEPTCELHLSSSRDTIELAPHWKEHDASETLNR